MSDIQHIHRKKDKQIYFEVQLDWVDDDRGVMHSRDVNGTIHVATPKQFGGEGKDWSPEHLFLSSICSCYMSTFVSFSKKMHFDITHFECSAIGQIELVDGKYKFTYINIFPEIYIADESLREKANLAIQKTQKYCLISNSIDVVLVYHSEVLIDHQRGHFVESDYLEKNAKR